MQQRMRQQVALIVLALMLGGPASSAVEVHLFGERAQVSPAPRLDDGVLLGAPTSIVGRLGCRFMTDAGGDLVIITPRNRRVVLQPGSDRMVVGETARTLPRKAFIAAEHLICPLRPVLEAIGCVVQFDQRTQTLDLATPIDAIEVFADDEGARVEVRAPLRIAASVRHIDGPERWYVDLGGAIVDLEHETTYVNRGRVLRVRWGQFSESPPVARVVVDVREREDDGGPLQVRWRPREGGPGGDLLLGTVDGDEPRMHRHVPKITRIATSAPNADTLTVRVELSDPVPVSYDVERAPPRVMLEMPDAAPDAPIAPVKVDGPFVGSVRLDGEAGRAGATLQLDMRELIQFEVVESLDPAAVTIIFRRERLADQRIVVDPGHGGRDSGARGRRLLEKDVNLDVARQVAARLVQIGAQTILTRDSDVFIDLYDRPGLANELDADLFVSIHCNAMPKPNTGHGTETYYYHPHSKCLGQIMQAELVRALGRRDNGLRWANFCVTRESEMPAVLVELMYLNHDAEHAVLELPETRTAAARAIVEGLRQYVEGTGTASERTDGELGF